jgi:hypothetical protein
LPIIDHHELIKILVSTQRMDNSLNFAKISKQAILNSIKKYDDKLEYAEDEITASEQKIIEGKLYKFDI